MLADVGLATQLEDGRSHASLGGVCGTTGYIDPLLNDSAQATPVTDGYAVGVTLLQALTGRPVANLKVACRSYPNPYLTLPTDYTDSNPILSR